MSTDKDEGAAASHVEVVATDTGFFGGNRRRSGDRFTVPAGTKSSWFKPVGEVDAEHGGEAPVDEQPKTLSQMAKTKPKGPVTN
jgi:hypothetical protein